MAVAAVSCYSVARYQSIRFTSTKMVGRDIHKFDAPVRAEMGGLAVLLGLAAGSTVFLLLDFPGDGTPIAFVAGLTAVAFTGLVGVADDIIELRQRYKPFLIVAASAPLMYFLQDRASIFIPVIGLVHIGILYPIVVVPLAITTSANFSNMLAGFNGLEAGIAVISLGTMSYLSAATGHPAIATLGFILTVAYFGFLVLNWYPARIFPGDSGTLMSGAALAAMGLLSGLEFQAILLSVPAATDFALKAMAKRPFGQRTKHGNTTVSQDGVLTPPSYPALVHAFMRVEPTKEKRLVLYILALEAIYAAIAIILGLNLVHLV
jgi:UDP-N-acetylglucosamine--dolichyl-phosphate N-acetylglucosaminephosphotransferase